MSRLAGVCGDKIANADIANAISLIVQHKQLVKETQAWKSCLEILQKLWNHPVVSQIKSLRSFAALPPCQSDPILGDFDQPG